MKGLIGANVLIFFAQALKPVLTTTFGLEPFAVIEHFWIWQLGTYMFLHGGVFHILFNMLALWMFGAELERIWGTRYFLKFYFVTGIGAGILTVLFSLLPFGVSQQVYGSDVIGASGAIYGLLLAYALYFPDRPIYMYLVFPIPAKYFVILYGAISLFMAVSGGGGGVAHFAHLGGLLVGYLYLKGRRMRLAAEIQYQFARWRINRARRRFDVHPGGRDDRPRYH